MHSFNSSIQQLLWPEKRLRDPQVGDKIPGPSYIQRTTHTSYIKVVKENLPDALRDLLGALGKDGIEIGPIPKGTPVSLLANLDLTPSGSDTGARLEHDRKLAALLKKMIIDLKQVKGKSDEEARAVFRNVVPDLMELSKCPDYVVNKGHYFGTNLSDSDKLALIEFLKTF
jgi:hypothetical protein